MALHRLLRWLPVFLFAQAIEMPLYALPLRRLGYTRPKRWLAAFIPTALTHPIVWFVFPRLVHPYLAMAIAAESFAVVVEALVLRRFGVQRALGWSLLANALSCGLGLAGRAWLGWP